LNSLNLRFKRLLYVEPPLSRRSLLLLYVKQAACLGQGGALAKQAKGGGSSIYRFYELILGQPNMIND